MERTPRPEPAGFVLPLRRLLIALFVIQFVACVACGLLAPHISIPGAASLVTTNSEHPPTPLPSTLGGVMLGGTTVAFTATYGAPLSTNPLIWRSTIARQAVQIRVDQRTGRDTLDRQPHISLVAIQPPPGSGRTWEASTAARLVAHFFPFDARHIQDFQAPDCPDHIYRSQGLAITYMPADFQVVNGAGNVPPGTFDWQCVWRTAAGGISTPPYDFCALEIGQSYAQ
jgi:hypothetical protein